MMYIDVLNYIKNHTTEYIDKNVHQVCVRSWVNIYMYIYKQITSHLSI